MAASPKCLALEGHAKHARLAVRRKSNAMAAGRIAVTALMEASNAYIHKMPDGSPGRPRLVFKVLRLQLPLC
jgi:hypothetical protein